jgi:hypothetical protein
MLGLSKMWFNRSAHNSVEHLEFHENDCREGHTYLMGVNEITFTCVV